MFEQKIYDYGEISSHEKKHHPMCTFCYAKAFYDQDSLNKHYVTEHHFCEVCKKLGKKRVQNSRTRHITLPDYDIYRDLNDLRKHQEKEHFVCDQLGNDLCRVQVFESSAQLASHFLNVHGKQMPVRLEFADHSDDERHYYGEEEEEKKESANVVITKENFKELFPTLGQAHKQQNVQ